MTDAILRLAARSIAAALLLGTALALAGCGGDTAPSTTPPAAPVTGTAVPPASTPPPTPTAEPLPPPAGFRVGSTGSRSITWQWEPVDGATLYAVRWSPTEHPAGTPARDTTEETTYALPVEPETTMFLWVAALRGSGDDFPDFPSDAFSGPVRGQSNPLARLTTPTGFRVTRISGHLIYLEWKAVEGAAAYEVRHRNDRGVGSTIFGPSIERLVSGRYEEVLFLNLRALPPDGADIEPSDWTEPIRVEMGIGPLPAPGGVNAVDTTSGSITWIWEAVEGAVDYECQWSQYRDFRSATGRYTELTTCTHFADQDVEMHFRVRGRRDIEPRLGRWSEPVQAEVEPAHVSETAPAWVPRCPDGERCADPEEWAESPLMYWDDPGLPDDTIIWSAHRRRHIWTRRPQPSTLPNNCADYEYAARKYAAYINLHPKPPLPFVVDVLSNFPDRPFGDRRPASYPLILKQIEALARQIEDGIGIEVIRAGRVVASRRSGNFILEFAPNDSSNTARAYPSRGKAEFSRWALARPRGGEGLNTPGAIAAIPHEILHLLGFHHRGGYDAHRALDGSRDGVQFADDGILDPRQTRFRDDHSRGRLFGFDYSLYLSAENLRRLYCVFREWPR